jgi:phosphohistidine phosphatase
MELYILRHGKAEPRRLGLAEEDRALVKKGKDDVRDVAKAVRRAKVEPQLILTSPLRRARETAEIAVSVFKGCPLDETNALLPDASPEATWKAACANTKVTRVVLVGHEPHLGLLISFLLGNEFAVDFKKGGMVRIDTPKRSGNPNGVMKWMLTPRLARCR